MLEPAPERFAVHEVRERTLAVDLEHGEELSIQRLEIGPAADVDDVELEAQLRSQPLHHFERPFAEAAVGGGIDGDLVPYG